MRVKQIKNIEPINYTDKIRKMEGIFICFVNPYRPHANGGSEEIKRRIEASSAFFKKIWVFAIDHSSELRINGDLPHNVELYLYARHLDPRPHRWILPIACVRRYNKRMIKDILNLLSSIDGKIFLILEGMQLFNLWLDIKKHINSRVCVALRVINIESIYHASLASVERGIIALVHKISSLQYSHYEQKLLKQFNLIFAISSTEYNIINQKYPKLRSRTSLVYPIPAKFDNCNFKFPNSIDSNCIIGYFGDLSLANNNSGLHWFCQHVLPALQLTSNVLLRIAGKGSQSFSVYDYVEVCGFVDNINNFISNLHIVIAPIFSGAGMKIKVIDIAASGKPLITTFVGADGLPPNIFGLMNIANDANDFQRLLAIIIHSYAEFVSRSEKLQLAVVNEMGSNAYISQLNRALSGENSDIENYNVDI